MLMNKSQTTKLINEDYLSPLKYAEFVRDLENIIVKTSKHFPIIIGSCLLVFYKKLINNNIALTSGVKIIP